MIDYIELNGPSDKELKAVKEPNKAELQNLIELFKVTEFDDLDEDYRLQEEVNDLMLADIEVQDPVDLW
jgi:hypothetical protein